METTEFIWHEGKFVKWEEAKVHVLTHTLHYGAGVFEGIRAYRTERGTAIFRLREHIDRLFYSAGTLQMEIPYTREQLTEATLELLRRNRLERGYIRPISFLGYGVMGLNPRGAPVETAIVCWPWGRYLAADAIDVKISRYIRIHPGSTVADAKICGHYVNSIFAVLELRGTNYHEALFMDADGFVAEGPGENFFMVKGGELITPPLGSILAGITRETVMTLARERGIRVVERRITRDELFSCDEAFFTGTAAEVTPIRSIDDQPLGGGGIGPVSAQLRSDYDDLVHGRLGRHEEFLSYVER